MKLHWQASDIWDHRQAHAAASPLALGCKRLSPLAPRVTGDKAADHGSALDRKSFIVCQGTGPARILDGRDPCPGHGVCSPQVETHQGGTRWNPTPEQVGMLETLYGGGMRTPNARQIEQIVAQLGKYGKIEGKNVFYWFQNHKARERQKQKRGAGGLTTYYVQFPQVKPSIPDTARGEGVAAGGEEEHTNGGADALRKRKCRSSSSSSRASPVVPVPRTLDLFPLRPEQ
ncbi:hypothetical protein MLD38_024734 [Melastoma candidum]|uniref:Uncharacterized protein n=1 Tax=Melastoma candidum TaxID=119954 RepID=A0ACB9NUY3_9MYRT|nr:hypothetical protein MLD38_024734 [Melastoma candidum]